MKSLPADLELTCSLKDHPQYVKVIAQSHAFLGLKFLQNVFFILLLPIFPVPGHKVREHLVNVCLYEWMIALEKFLIAEGHERTFWSDDDNLYPDYGSGYTGICIC